MSHVIVFLHQRHFLICQKNRRIKDENINGVVSFEMQGEVPTKTRCIFCLGRESIKLILTSFTIALFSKLQTFRKYVWNWHFFRKFSKILLNFESIFEKFVISKKNVNGRWSHYKHHWLFLGSGFLGGLYSVSSAFSHYSPWHHWLFLGDEEVF